MQESNSMEWTTSGGFSIMNAPTPPERSALDVTLGSREEWTEDMI